MHLEQWQQVGQSIRKASESVAEFVYEVQVLRSVVTARHRQVDRDYDDELFGFELAKCVPAEKIRSLSIARDATSDSLEAVSDYFVAAQVQLGMDCLASVNFSDEELAHYFADLAVGPSFHHRLFRLAEMTLSWYEFVAESLAMVAEGLVETANMMSIEEMELAQAETNSAVWLMGAISVAEIECAQALLLADRIPPRIAKPNGNGKRKRKKTEVRELPCDVREFLISLRGRDDHGRKIAIAREICGGDDARAESLVRRAKYWQDMLTQFGNVKNNVD